MKQKNKKADCDLVPVVLKTAFTSSLYSFIFVTYSETLLEGLW